MLKKIQIAFLVALMSLSITAPSIAMDDEPKEVMSRKESLEKARYLMEHKKALKKDLKLKKQNKRKKKKKKKSE